MKSTTNVWKTFMESDYARQELDKIEKKAQQYSVNMDRGPLYDNVKPTGTGQTYPETQLNPTVETQGVNAGGASMVGSEDRAPLYTTSPAGVPGGQEQYADPKVEGLDDVAKAMMDVAMKDPTGAPHGTQDNMPESWDGIQAAGGAKVKSFLKEGQDVDPQKAADFIEGFSGSPMMEQSSESGEDELNAILNEIETEEAQTVEASSKKKETLATLKELYKVANELDQLGQYEDANAIDDVLREQVKELVTAKKK